MPPLSAHEIDNAVTHLSVSQAFVHYSLFVSMMALGAAFVFFLSSKEKILPAYRGTMTTSAIICGVAAVAYYFLTAEYGPGKPFPTDVRYVDWTVTTPLLLLKYPEMLRLRGYAFAWKLVLADLFMIVTGFIGELYGSTVDGHWVPNAANSVEMHYVWGAVSTLGYLVIVYLLLTEGEPPGEDTAGADPARHPVHEHVHLEPVGHLPPGLHPGRDVGGQPQHQPGLGQRRLGRRGRNQQGRLRPDGLFRGARPVAATTRSRAGASQRTPPTRAADTRGPLDRNRLMAGRRLSLRHPGGGLCRPEPLLLSAPGGRLRRHRPPGPADGLHGRPDLVLLERPPEPVHPPRDPLLARLAAVQAPGRGDPPRRAPPPATPVCGRPTFTATSWRPLPGRPTSPCAWGRPIAGTRKRRTACASARARRAPGLPGL